MYRQKRLNFLKRKSCRRVGNTKPHAAQQTQKKIQYTKSRPAVIRRQFISSLSQNLRQKLYKRSLSKTNKKSPNNNIKKGKTGLKVIKKRHNTTSRFVSRSVQEKTQNKNSQKHTRLNQNKMILFNKHEPLPDHATILPELKDLHVYCINLDRRPDRWQNIQESWKQFGSPGHLHRIPAVDTGDMRGCGLSHQKIIRMAKEKKLPYVVVVEGDALFYQNARETYRKLKQSLKKPSIPWDIILGGVHYFSGPKSVYKPALVKISDFSATHFVIYRYTCYDVVLSWRFGHIDRYLGRNIRHKLVCYPFLSYTKDGYSELRKRNVNDQRLYKKYQLNLRNLIMTS